MTLQTSSFIPQNEKQRRNFSKYLKYFGPRAESAVSADSWRPLGDTQVLSGGAVPGRQERL